MNHYRIRYYSGNGQMAEMVIPAMTADDALTIYEIKTGGRRHRNRSSMGPLVYDVADIEALDGDPAQPPAESRGQ